MKDRFAMQITIEFFGTGGLVDGAATLERDITPGEQMLFQEWIVMTVGVTSNFQYNVGHHFQVPSPGWLARYVVRPGGQSEIPTFEYEIIESLREDHQILVRARFVGQRSTDVGGPSVASDPTNQPPLASQPETRKPT
jgi:hypothetical protein